MIWNFNFAKVPTMVVEVLILITHARMHRSLLIVSGKTVIVLRWAYYSLYYSACNTKRLVSVVVYALAFV
jgi:hypothetical protein